MRSPEGQYVVNTREISAQKDRERELEETVSRLNRFTDAVSHDIRGPLNVAMGRLELAQEECDSDHLENVAQALERIGTLTDDLVALARSGEGLADREVIDLSELSRECWQTIATGDATLEIDVDRRINGDRSRVMQLLENLMRNAVEHAGRDVTVTIGELLDGDGFYVADDGPGIPAVERTEILEEGYSTSSDGTGLGLTIVQDVAGAHGWEMRIADGGETGARFEFANVDWV